MSEKSKESEQSERQNRKKRVPVCSEVEILTLAEAVEQTGWSPEELIETSTWGYLHLFCLDEQRNREIVIKDYLEHRK